MTYLHDVIAHIQSTNKISSWPEGYREIFIYGEIVVLATREEGSVYFEDFSNHNRICMNVILDNNTAIQ